MKRQTVKVEAATVYKNRKYTERSARFNWRIKETGDRFRMLQLEMARPRPTRAELYSLPPQYCLYELLACVRCGNVPDPKDYMTCEDKGHRICGSCALKKPRVPESTTNSNKFFKEKPWEPCCVQKLSKGRSLLFEAVLKIAQWKCPNVYNGCNEIILGAQWDEHVNSCKFKPR